jgi:hypothetical protein
MKTLKILLLFIATAVLLGSCNDDEEFAKPTIKFDPESPIVAEFTSGTYAVDVQVTIKADAKIKTTVVNVYIDGSIDNARSSAQTAAVNGDRNEADFVFRLRDALTEASFETSVVYEVIITDQKDQETKERFTINKTAEPAVTYTYTVTVKSGDLLIEGATVTVNEDLEETTNENGVATFTLEAGEYTYTVAKEGYEESTGTFTVTENGNYGVNLTATTTELSAWSSEITMGMKGSWTEDPAYPKAVGEPYGFEYKTNGTDGANMHIDAVNNAKFVEVTATEAEGFTTSQSLVEKFDASTQVEAIMQPFVGGAKAFAAKTFISRVPDGSNYKYFLIKTTAAQQHYDNNATSHIKFVEKH